MIESLNNKWSVHVSTYFNHIIDLYMLQIYLGLNFVRDSHIPIIYTENQTVIDILHVN